MKKIKEQIEAALERGLTPHGSPSNYKKIKEWGVNISDGSGIMPWEEFVEKVFSDEQKTKALERAKTIPELPNIPLPIIKGIYREILKCITLGMNGAAITLSCILVEYMLRFASYKVEIGAFKRYDQSKWDKLEKETFGPSIERADNNGLLTDDRKTSLVDFKNKIRNPYLHYNIKKITAGVILRNVTRINMKTGDSEQIDISADSDPTVQPDAKVFVDEQEVLNVFGYANEFVKEMWGKIEHLENVASPPPTLD